MRRKRIFGPDQVEKLLFWILKYIVGFMLILLALMSLNQTGYNKISHYLQVKMHGMDICTYIFFSILILAFIFIILSLFMMREESIENGYIDTKPYFKNNEEAYEATTAIFKFLFTVLLSIGLTYLFFVKLNPYHLESEWISERFFKKNNHFITTFKYKYFLRCISFIIGGAMTWTYSIICTTVIKTICTYDFSDSILFKNIFKLTPLALSVFSTIMFLGTLLLRLYK